MDAGYGKSERVMPLKLALDLDSVIFDFMNPFTDHSERVLKRALPRELPSWNIWEHWGITKFDWEWLYKDFIAEGAFQKLPPMPGAMDAIEELKRQGHSIHVITSRGLRDEPRSIVKANEDSLYSLFRWGNFQDSVIFTFDKSIVNADILLDDGVHNLEIFKSGIPICFNQSYNQDWTGERVHNWVEFVSFVEELEKMPVVIGNRRPAALNLASGEDWQWAFKGYKYPIDSIVDAYNRRQK